MALAFTRTDINIKIAGGRRFRVVEVTTDGAYAAGGYAITAANLGLEGAIELVIPGGGTGGFVPGWDHANKKLKFYKTGSALSGELAECAANEAGLNGDKYVLFAVGY
jgi:hypothetical protein